MANKTLIKAVTSRDIVISMLKENCNAIINNCHYCKLYRSGEECDFEGMSDAELVKAVGILLGVESDNTNTHVSAVNHPSHYQGANECIDVMRAMFGDEAVRGFCKCNAYKYRFRAEHKNGAEDIRKAEWYESYLIGMDKEEKGNG